jgi:hypothetical protein
MSAPIRGQRRRGVPSLVLPGDPDGCGFERERGQSSAEVPRYWLAGEWYDADEPDAVPLTVRYVGRPSRWGNPAKVVDDGGLGVRYAVMVDGPGFCGGLYADRAAANTRAAWAYESSSRKWVKDEPIELARHLAPLVTADVLSCWCPLDAPCHADTLCDLVGRLRSGDLVPGLVATPDVCGGALRIDGYDGYTVSELADEVRDVATYGDWTSDEAIENIASDEGVDSELVRLAVRVGGAL